MLQGFMLSRLRVLPATIAVMGTLIVVMTVRLAGVATAGEKPPEAGMDAPAPQAAEGAGAKPPAEAARPAAAEGGVAGAAAASGAGATAGAAAPGGLPAAVAAAEAAPMKAEDKPVSPAERSLLLDLRHRHDTLEERAHALDQREAVLGAAEARLTARVAELDALQRKLETLETARQAHDSANWAGLVKLYETMKPRDAAAIFDALDMQVLLPVLDRMAERKAAPVLAAMQPDRARLATQLLAEMRTRMITPAGEKPAVKPDPKG